MRCTNCSSARPSLHPQVLHWQPPRSREAAPFESSLPIELSHHPTPENGRSSWTLGRTSAHRLGAKIGPSASCKVLRTCARPQLVCIQGRAPAGGDGLLSSPRQYCFSDAMDIRSANPSSCPQVFHSELHSSRRGVTRIVQGRAHARTLRALNSSTSAVIRSPHMSAASRWQKALPAPSHF